MDSSQAGRCPRFPRAARRRHPPGGTGPGTGGRAAARRRHGPGGGDIPTPPPGRMSWRSTAAAGRRDRVVVPGRRPLPLDSPMSRPADLAAHRRTFAIISHPDAGKTTLTEKFLLYGGAVQEAGQVKARGERRRVRSVWMELEQKRGISITSAVLQFPYGDDVLNLLDTPGHRDFSEDTYRVLAAVDAAVMVLDSAKGI